MWSRQENVENIILQFQLAEQIFQDSEREHIYFQCIYDLAYN